MKNLKDYNIYIVDVKHSEENNYNEKKLIISPAVIVGFCKDVVITKSKNGIKYYLINDYNKYYFTEHEEAISHIDYLEKTKDELELHLKKVRRYIDYATNIGVQLNTNYKTLKKSYI